MNNMLCIECDRYIHGFKYKTTLYRCGDANVCSKICSGKRYNKLQTSDPYLVSPVSWPHTKKNNIKKTISLPSFYPDTILEIDNIDPVYENHNNYNTITELLIIIYDFVYNTLLSIILLTKYN